MRSLSGQPEFFGLDLGVTAARVVELKGTAEARSLDRYGWAEFEGSESLSDAEVDKNKVMDRVIQLLRDTGISNRNVAVNIPSNHVFTTVVEMDKLPMDELAQTIRYQADTFIPTPLAESKVDWAVIGDSPKDPKKIEVLLSSVPNDYIVGRLDMLERRGLNVVAFEPDTMAIARSLVVSGTESAQMVLDIGNTSTDLVIVIKEVPHLSRSIAIGDQAISQAAMQQLKIDHTQAVQYVSKFGLSKDKMDGHVYGAIIGIVDSLVAEIEKSIKFFQGRYPNQRLEKIIVTGGASALPEFPLYVANKFGINVEIGNAWRNVSIPANRQNEVAAVSNHFAVAVGLAEREI
jgi:type IV pilus assembly protein PilM